MRMRIWAMRGLAAACVVTAIWVMPASASAAEVKFEFFDETGASSAGAEVPRKMRVTGTSGADQSLYVTVGGADREPCLPSYHADLAAGYAPLNDYALGEYSRYFRFGLPGGAFDESFDVTWKEAGQFVTCAWITGRRNEIATPIRQALTFESEATPVPSDNTSPGGDQGAGGDAEMPVGGPEAQLLSAPTLSSTSASYASSTRVALIGAGFGAGAVLLLVIIVMLVRSNRKLRRNSKPNDSDSNNKSS